MSNKTRGIILGVLGRLQKDITFDECHRNKTYYDGVKHGIKLSKKAIENIPAEDLLSNSIKQGCLDCKYCVENKCVHLYYLYCKHYELWTPKWFND